MRYLVFTIIAFVATVADADDSIRITFASGYPMPGSSTETSNVYITRESGDYAEPSRKSEIDSYFELLRKTLDEAKTPAVWEPAPAMHADTVRVEIVLGSRKHVLAASYGAQGPEIYLDASAFDRRQLAAIKDILRLTTESLKVSLLGER